MCPKSLSIHMPFVVNHAAAVYKSRSPCFHFLWVQVGSEWLDHREIPCVLLWGAISLLSMAGAPFHIPTISVQGFFLPILTSTSDILYFFIITMEWQWGFICGRVRLCFALRVTETDWQTRLLPVDLLPKLLWLPESQNSTQLLEPSSAATLGC